MASHQKGSYSRSTACRYLRFLNGLSLKETAAILGKEVGNIKAIPNRAIAALRTILDYQTVKTRAISLAFGED
jgi:DNA-directed RNA polymerase specialized sigma24 family protein